MKCEQLLRRVSRAESLVDGRRQQTVEHFQTLTVYWKRGLAPWQIVLAGLGLGYIAGQVRPSLAVGAAGLLNAAGSISGILASIQEAMSVWQFSDKGEVADAAQNEKDGRTAAPDHDAVTRAAGMSTADIGTDTEMAYQSGSQAERAAQDELWNVQPPRPAEAATDVSEQR